MTIHSIAQGLPYHLSVMAKDGDGNQITVDGTWKCFCRLTKNRMGGAEAASIELTAAAGVFAGEIDTTAIDPGCYFYDIAIVDASGNPFVSEPTQLNVTTRNSPLS